MLKLRSVWQTPVALILIRTSLLFRFSSTLMGRSLKGAPGSETTRASVSILMMAENKIEMIWLWATNRDNVVHLLVRLEGAI